MLLAASISTLLKRCAICRISASPTATSAAAMARMNMNMTWPSACCHREPATIKASPAAFNMISTDISMKITLRRTNRPINPSANRTLARNSPCSIGIIAMALLHRPGTLALPTTQVIGPNQAGQQQHGGQLDADKVRPVEGDTHLLWRDDSGAGGWTPGLGQGQDIEQLP